MLQMWPNLNLSNFTGIQSITLLSSIRGMTERNPADSDDEQNINWLYININTVIKTHETESHTQQWRMDKNSFMNYQQTIRYKTFSKTQKIRILPQN